jgi:hypothetical protein
MNHGCFVRTPYGRIEDVGAKEDWVWKMGSTYPKANGQKAAPNWWLK